ncbi:unnamed protein product [Polarella glacialis]|uniref:Uncharacterized protein n=1 Tax=Polarella glacialis TaxID=89957 RepID=A0A813IV93_POLGL|nr:unnamed protein product [Polarella glacialis]
MAPAAERERSRSPPAAAKPEPKTLGTTWMSEKDAGSVPLPKPGKSVAPFTYQGDEVPRGLLASGKVGTKRDASGADGDYFGCDFVRRDCAVTNGRGKGFNLDDNGFQLVDHNIEHIDYFNNEKTVSDYYPMCCELVKRMTGAETVYAFDHNVRSKAKAEAEKKVDGGNAIQGPAFVVHNDYSSTSAPVDDLLKGRWALINDHQWSYFPEMTRDEAVLLKVWDSAGEAFKTAPGKSVPATFSFHSAFEDPSSKPDAEDRESVEVRTIAFFPAES